MRIFWIALLISLFTPLHDTAAQTCSTLPAAHHSVISQSLKHGVNLSRWWEDTRDQIPTEADFEQITATGFDFVRLPVSPVWFEDNDDAVAALHCDLLNLTARGLRVIVDLHAHGAFKTRQVDADPDTAFDNILAVWKHIAPALDGLPDDQILIGVYNEPGIKTDPWWDVQDKLVTALRTIFPKQFFVVTSSPNSGVWEYGHLSPYNDPNIYYDFHFYEPMVLTHHKAPWVKMFQNGAGGAPIIYPYDSHFSWDTSDPLIEDYVKHQWNKQQLSKLIQGIRAWADTHHTRILCLEFGVYRDGNDAQSRVNWLADMRSLLEGHHIPWALWEYRGSFGLLDKNGQYDKVIIQALGLQIPPQTP